MAKRRDNEWMGEFVELPEEDVLVEEDNFLSEELVQEEPETVRIMLGHDVILEYTGVITGKLYVFNRGGSILDVDKKDAEIMLKRTEQQSCCGSFSSPYFIIVR